MIIAEREHLEDLMQQQAVEMRMKEEKVVSSSFRTLSSTATYLAASAFAILYANPTYLVKNHGHDYLNANTGPVEALGFRENDDPYTVFLQTVTTGLASMSVGFCVMVMGISSWCLIFGTELAFRGEDQGSMSRALDGLYAERKWAVRFFLGALSTTLLSGLSHVHLVVRSGTGAAVPCATLLALGTLAALYLRRRVRPRFAFPEGEKNNRQGDLHFAGGFDPEIRRNVQVRGDDRNW